MRDEPGRLGVEQRLLQGILQSAERLPLQDHGVEPRRLDHCSLKLRRDEGRTVAVPGIERGPDLPLATPFVGGQRIGRP